MSLPPLRVHFVSVEKESSDDRIRWEGLLKKATSRRNQILCKPKSFGIRDPFMDGDLQIHLGLPIYGAIPWSYVNWLWLGRQVWSDAWDGYLASLDAVWFEAGAEGEVAAEALRARCREKGWGSAEEKIRVMGAEAVESVMEGLEEGMSQLKCRKPARGLRHLPPVLERADCPPISIITPTFQRKKLMEIAYHNLLSTDYPIDKIEWIVVEDNDKSPHVMKESLAGFRQKVPSLPIRYIPLEGRRSVGEKRNVGIAAASHEWILFMDDDDHYPPTSFRRRMAWLLKGSVGGRAPRIACCTTIALYDLKRGVSAVNVPPPALALSQRVSEATLTFHRSVWEERSFPEVSLSEGEDWIQGRESDMIELPPQQIIVAFTHGGNQSSRRLPPSNQPPACFWNFPKEYLTFIHGLVGVDVSYE
jgi:Glycosyl transferase family 2